MKAIWICIILAVIIAILIILPHVFITNTSREIREVLQKADAAVENEDWLRAAVYCESASEKWEKYTAWYEMIVEHQEVDEIIRSLRQLGRFVSENEKPEARALIAELDFLVNHLKENDSLSAENIF